MLKFFEASPQRHVAQKWRVGRESATTLRSRWFRCYFFDPLFSVFIFPLRTAVVDGISSTYPEPRMRTKVPPTSKQPRQPQSLRDSSASELDTRAERFALRCIERDGEAHRFQPHLLWHIANHDNFGVLWNSDAHCVLQAYW